MTVTTVFTDAVGIYTSADVLKKWTSGSITGLGPSDTDTDSKQILVPSSLRKSGLPSNIGCMAMVRFHAVAPVGTVIILSFFQAGTTVGFLRMNGSGQLEVTDRLLNVLASDTLHPLDLTISPPAYSQVEFGYLVDGTNGRIEVRVDGTQIAALSSAAFGGSVSNTLTTNTGGVTAIDGFEITGNNCVNLVDHTIVRTADAAWSSGDWFGVIKKKTVQLRAGSAGDGQYSGVAWTIGAGTGSNSDVIRTIPFKTDDNRYLVNSNLSGGNQDLLTLQLESCPADVGVLKCVSHVWSMRQTGGGADLFAALYDPNNPPNLYMPAVSYFPLTGYSFFQAIYDNDAVDGTPWTKPKFDGDGATTGIQIGLKVNTPSS